MTVVKAVKLELETLGPNVAESSLAAAALTLARELDKAKNSATSKSMCAKVLMDVLSQIRAQAPPKKQEDRVDEIAKRRAKRVGSVGA